MPGVVVLLAYSRPALLSRCLDSLFESRDSEKTCKVLVLQPGEQEVEDLILSRASRSTVIVRSHAFGSTPTQRMMSQLWLGIDVALAQPGRDWIMTLEEDSIISEDALFFVDEMHKRYRHHSRFRGVNLGSVETDETLRGTYSLIRYGYMGHAGALPRRHWVTARYALAKGRRRYEPFDCLAEPALKTGFMATPNLTKSMNFGWIDGTHVTNEPAVLSHFDAMRESWELGDCTSPYTRRDVPHSWRADAIPFRTLDDPRYWALMGKSLLGSALRKYGYR
jgi:hypothetical protein